MNRQRLPLNAIRAFESAIRLGSVTAASNELCVTQGAVSRQIKNLENVLGLSLVRRDQHVISPTAVGNAMAGDLTTALNLMETTIANAQNGADVLRLQASPSLAIRWLVPRLEQIGHVAPELDIRITTTLLNDRFDHRSFDAGIIYGDGNWPELNSILLQREYLVPVISPSLADGPVPARTIADLDNHTLLHAKIDHSDWSSWLKTVGNEHTNSDVGPAFETMDLAIRSAERGLGITLGNLAFVKSSLDEGKLIVPFGPAVYAGLGYYLVYPNSANFNETIDRCLAWVCKNSPEALGTLEEVLTETALDLWDGRNTRE